MSEEKAAIVILAAGLGKRMGSQLPKVITSTVEKPLILHALSTALSLDPVKIVIVTGHGKEAVEDTVRGALPHDSSAAVTFAFQEQQRGTGDAMKSALPALDGFRGPVLILYGDCPLLRAATLRSFHADHNVKRATISFISFMEEESNQYGRVLRDSKGAVTGIREARDCSPDELSIREVNSGVYIVDSSFLSPAVSALENNNAQGEFYLTDIVGKAAREGQSVNAWVTPSKQELLGVNTLSDLSIINKVLRMNKVSELIDSGVTVEDPQTCYVDASVKVEKGAVIGPNVKLLGKTVIESGAVIEGTAVIIDSTIGRESSVKLASRIEGSIIGPRCSVGPFANIRPGCNLAEEVKIGNFVEAKKAEMGRGSKASHLTYLGDCEVGEHANIGAGTITCNYDGYHKYKTKIGKNAFIGSNTALVAPVTVEEGATIGAGSVISKDVDKDALAFTRAPQLSKSGWSKRKREMEKPR